jgi:hypothetical protein
MNKNHTQISEKLDELCNQYQLELNSLAKNSPWNDHFSCFHLFTGNSYFVFINHLSDNYTKCRYRFGLLRSNLFKRIEPNAPNLIYTMERYKHSVYNFKEDLLKLRPLL